MKRNLKLFIGGVVLCIGIFFVGANNDSNTGFAQTQDIVMPDVVVLGKDAKLGGVTFNHVSHNGGKYSIDGTGPIACIECHHTAQPAADLEKHPPRPKK